MEIIIIVLLILLNGIFSMSEIALVSARKARLESEIKKGNKRAKAALQLAEEPNKFLSTIQVGITLIGILIGLYSGKALANDFAEIIIQIEFLAPYSLFIATVIIVLVVTYLTIVFGELVPKCLGLSMSEHMAKAVARPMLLFSKIMTPIVWLLSQSTAMVLKFLGIKNREAKIAEEEINTMLKEELDTGEVEEVEHDIIGRVFDLCDRDIDSIMTCRSDFIWLDNADDKEKIHQTVMENMHAVYPVKSGNHEGIVGVVYMKDLFATINQPEFSLKSLMHVPRYLSINKSVYSALEYFKENTVKYGFVIDEYGDVKGIVTLVDIMEALVGEGVEKGKEKYIIVREDGSLLVDGQCSFYTFLEFVDREDLYPNYGYNTLSGLILEELKRSPVEGEKISWQGFCFEIVDMDGSRIDKVLACKNFNFFCAN